MLVNKLNVTKLTSSIKQPECVWFATDHNCDCIVIKDSWNVLWRKFVCGVRDEEASFTDSSVTDNNTLYSLHISSLFFFPYECFGLESFTMAFSFSVRLRWWSIENCCWCLNQTEKQIFFISWIWICELHILIRINSIIVFIRSLRLDVGVPNKWSVELEKAKLRTVQIFVSMSRN